MKLKKIFIAVVVVILVLASIFFVGRYGWKLRGFASCQSAGIESIQVADDFVEIKGYDPSLVPDGFIGYYSEEVDGKLYVGFKFSGIFGFFETGDFQIQIPVESEIEEVYMKTKKNENLIWSKTDDENSEEDSAENILDKSDENTNISDDEELDTSAYDQILEVYVSAVEQEWNMGDYIREELNYLLADSHHGDPMNDIGYAMTDLDEDGNLELLVGSRVEDDFFGKMIFFLYTLEEGTPKLIFNSGERDRYYYAGDALFAHEGASSAAEAFETTMKYENSELVDLNYVTDSADYVQMELIPFSRWVK